MSDYPECDIWPTPAQGVSSSFQIHLEQTGPATADIRIIEYVGPPLGPPSTDNTYSLDTIMVCGLTIVAKTSAMWLRPTVTIVLRPPPAPAVSITVEHSIFKDGSTNYPLAAADYAKLIEWLKVCNFPAV